jgi:hypothetical protein
LGLQTKLPSARDLQQVYMSGHGFERSTWVMNNHKSLNLASRFCFCIACVEQDKETAAAQSSGWRLPARGSSRVLLGNEPDNTLLSSTLLNFGLIYFSTYTRCSARPLQMSFWVNTETENALSPPFQLSRHAHPQLGSVSVRRTHQDTGACPIRFLENSELEIDCQAVR